VIVDHRTYTFHPGQMKPFLELYEREGYPIQSRILGEPLGWYVCTDIGPLNQLVHVWGYESLDERARKRAELAADPGWQAYVHKLHPMLVSMENKILTQPAFIRGRRAA
jgi:hypothetical protein